MCMRMRPGGRERYVNNDERVRSSSSRRIKVIIKAPDCRHIFSPPARNSDYTPNIVRDAKGELNRQRYPVEPDCLVDNYELIGARGVINADLVGTGGSRKSIRRVAIAEREGREGEIRVRSVR